MTVSARRRFGTGRRGPLLTSSPPIFLLRPFAKPWAMGLLPPAPVDPKLCAPQVGQTRLIWPVGVLGKAGPSVLSCRPHLWGRRLGAAAAQFKARGSVM